MMAGRGEERAMPSLSRAQVLIFGTVLAGVLVAALFPFFPRQLPVHEGDIATRDIRSPRDMTFESDTLTNLAREDAAEAVPPVLLFDPNVRNEQIGTLQSVADRIDGVREDDGLSAEEKRGRLLNIEELDGLSRQSVDTVLTLSDGRWRLVTDEAENALDSVMSQSVAAEGIPSVQDGLLQQISATLSADEAVLAADLVRPLIVATQLIDEEATEEAQQTARDNVEPVQQSVAQGQLIVEEGRPIDATTAEVLREVGLLTPRIEWRDLASVVILAVLGAIVVTIYVWLFPVRAIASERNLVLLALVIGVPVLLAKLYFSLVLPDDERRFLAYFLPLPAIAMLVATLLETRLALLIGLVQVVLLTFAVVYQPDLSLVATIEPVDAARVLLVYGLSTLMGVFAVHRAQQPNQFVAAGFLAGGVALAGLFAIWLIEPQREGNDVVWMTAAALVLGLSSGLLSAGGLAALGTVIGVTTRVQLMELSQLNAPLLRRLQDEAPGTFHHSIIVGNLAERAADLIGADSLLVRVGCYYHDIGKVLQPGFYIENQMAGDNPHDMMEPKQSAGIIAQHVKGGLELARRERLPPRVQAFIPEHHGTRLIAYFYRVASQRDPKVEPSLFRYPGPKPQSRETAIVMLADSTEAMVRASEDRSSERIDAIVEEVISERMAEGELDYCDLTLRDIRTIAESFKQTLRGVYHPRIAYPEPTERERRALIGRFRPGRRSAQTPPPAAEPARRAPRSRRRAT
jgi:putative nucleotidyltransferase with HDIG domain